MAEPTKDDEVDQFLKNGTHKKKPADFDDENEFTSVCGRADYLNCCPSRHQIEDGTLCNRLVMATFAVILLWISSLQVALSIVQMVIPTPTTTSVFSSCR